MTAITSYATLQEAIGSWLNRTTSAMAFGPTDLIPLFEARMNRKLRTPEMEVQAEASAEGETVSLPSDFLQMRELRVDGEAIPALNPQALRGRCETAPLAYAVVGQSVILHPAPSEDAPVTVEMTYYQRIPALSDGNTSNWLLEMHPDLYLFGSLARANAFLRDDESAAMWKATEDEILSEIMDAALKQRLPAGPLVMRGSTAE